MSKTRCQHIPERGEGETVPRSAAAASSLPRLRPLVQPSSPSLPKIQAKLD